jgi:hypothetical protein
MGIVTAPQKLVKQPGETRQFSMDFSNLMSTGETISDQTVTATLDCGDASDLTISSITVVSQIVYCWIAGGTHGTTHRVQFTATTSTSQIVQGDGILYVRDE